METIQWIFYGIGILFLSWIGWLIYTKFTRLKPPTPIDRISFAAAELSELVPKFSIDDQSDERGPYFRGLLEQTRDSLIAIEKLQVTGNVWPLHCRWIIEAFNRAWALKDDPSLIANLKRSSMNTYLLIKGVEDAKRKTMLDKIGPEDMPGIEPMFKKLESTFPGLEKGAAYNYYRLLCERTHLELNCTSAYPRLGLEASDVVEHRKNLFLWFASSFALMIPDRIHCPPAFGLSDEGYKRAEELVKVASQDLPATT